MRSGLILLFVTSCAVQQNWSRTRAYIPVHAVQLEAAQCVTKSAWLDYDYWQPLRSAQPISLFADETLEWPLDRIAPELMYGRQVSASVWAVLVTDSKQQLCEVFVTGATPDDYSPVATSFDGECRNSPVIMRLEDLSEETFTAREQMSAGEATIAAGATYRATPWSVHKKRGISRQDVPLRDRNGRLCRAEISVGGVDFDFSGVAIEGELSRP